MDRKLKYIQIKSRVGHRAALQPAGTVARATSYLKQPVNEMTI